MAIGLSQVFATQILVPLTVKMSLADSFGTSALMMFTLTLPAILMVREPTPKQKEPVNNSEDQSPARQAEVEADVIEE